MNFPVPPNEPERLKRLREYRILDTQPEQRFDDLTYLASFICECPVAMINLIDSDRQWTKSIVGFQRPELSREIAFCAHTIAREDFLVVNDLSADDRFRNNPLVCNEPSARFYAGVPVFSHDGLALGSLCVLDKKPRQLNEQQLQALQALARQVHDQMELRRNLLGLKEAVAHFDDSRSELAASEERFRRILDTSKDGILVERDEKVMYMNQAYAELFGRSGPEQLLGVHLSELAAPEDLERLLDYGRRRAKREPAPTHYEFKIKQTNGTLVDLEAAVSDFFQNDHHYIITFARDIRERKRHEAEREKMIVELKDALSKVKTLQGLLPICASCKKIRDDTGYWSQIEEYIESRTDADFTHGICPDCARRLYPDLP